MIGLIIGFLAFYGPHKVVCDKETRTAIHDTIFVDPAEEELNQRFEALEHSLQKLEHSGVEHAPLLDSGNDKEAERIKDLEQSKTEVEDRIKKLEEAAAILPQRSDAEVEDRLKKLEAWIDGENKWINSAKKKKKKDKGMSSSVELPAEEVGSSAQAEDLEEGVSEKKNTTARKSTEDGSVEAQGVEEAAAEEETPHRVEHY